MTTKPKQDDTTLYIVWWPNHDVLKVGVTNHASRIRKHQLTGGILIGHFEHSTRKQERTALEHVSFAFDRAFLTAESATEVLGAGGIGFSECFKVPSRHITGALELAYIGMRRGAGGDG